MISLAVMAVCPLGRRYASGTGVANSHRYLVQYRPQPLDLVGSLAHKLLFRRVVGIVQP